LIYYIRSVRGNLRLLLG